MTGAREKATETRVFERVVGEYDSGVPGPLFLALGGIHGNEPSGIHAAERVLATLEKVRPAMRGRFVALAGNLEALRRKQRFVDYDLNRMWGAASIERVRNQDPALDTVEETQQRELLSAIDALMDQAGDDGLIFLDLHSSSAPGAPFTAINDTLQNRKIAFALPCPALIGLEENVKGPLLEYVAARGHVAVAVEGGQHDDPATIDRHEASLWTALNAGGLIDHEAVPGVTEHYTAMKDSARGLPGVLEIVHRHALEPGDGFKMLPGFNNFSAVKKGRQVAEDQLGDIRVMEDGYLLLPLYQGQGEDGFFLGREVRRFWLRLSTVMRLLRLDNLLPLLPGVSRHPTEREVIYANPDIVRWFAAEFFHLTGYKRCPDEDGRMVFLRRPDRR